ncbi:MAG: 3-hydroxyacyl-CoA dehydrogenase family protein [Desulfobacteraceae bacterium]|nr:3-hydroxyacyl-CoA dehydrogenase family protein [Desulfobacteraceae bacterium]
MTSEKTNCVSVIGAGTMGVGIVQCFAEAGIFVRMMDIDKQLLEQSLASVDDNLRLFDEFNLLSEPPSVILSRIKLITSGNIAEDAAGSDFVIESVPEVMETKKMIFNQLDSLPQETIIASNTSSITMDDLTGGMRTSRRMLGVHYFNPAHIIPAVEIHTGKNTGKNAVEQTRELMVRTGKKPVIVKKPVPGFIINRLTGAMEREIDYLIDEGIVTPEDLDTAVKASYGFRLACMGPMAQEDMIGLDTSARVSSNIFKVLSNKTEPSPILLEKVEKGELGLKSGQGWYDYTGQSREKITEQINRRLLKQLALFRSVEN